MVMLITSKKQIIFINSFNFDEKSLIRFKKFNAKDKIVSIFLKLELSWNLKNMEDQFNIFRDKKIIKLNIFYPNQNVKGHLRDFRKFWECRKKSWSCMKKSPKDGLV